MQHTIDQAHEQLHNGTGLGNEYLGWLHYPKTIDKKQLKNIKIAAKTIQQHSDILIVIGVGGSYLGALAAIELLTHTFQNELLSTKRQVQKVIFAGHHLSGTYMHDLFQLVEDKQISVNVISKSDSTTETAIDFRIVKQYMEKRYSKVEIHERIFITTGETDGPLKTLAEQENLKLFTIPDSIGGRYSVLTPVGLLPIAVSGISIKSIIEGAVLATKETMSNEISENSSYSYATLRYILYTKGKKLELFSAYEPRWHYFQQWWKQLF